MMTEQLQITRLRLLSEIDKAVSPDRIPLSQAVELLESLRDDIAIRLEALAQAETKATAQARRHL